jgi:hypothetical protein
MNKNKTQYGKPYTAREYRSVGIAMIITGLLATLVCISAYRFGSEAQMVSTKWGTEILPENGPGNTIYLILGAGGMGMVTNRFDVFLISLDPTRGSKIRKTRPCLVISPDEMNER